MNNTELPNEIEVNGVKYRRVDDYLDDQATRLLRRVEGVAKAADVDLTQAAWAIAATFDKANGKQITPWPQ